MLYQSGDQIMASNYTVKGDTFVVDKPRVWLAKLGGTEWDLAPDGKRVAVLSTEFSEDRVHWTIASKGHESKLP